ncbi:MAG: cytochrome b [Alphaproteobacteria bacterium]|nr:cytochrome b [Alphaproteobacteria bacterium]
MSENYTKIAIILHWLIGLAIIAMIAMGLILEDIPDDYKFMAYQLHKSIGLTILGLSFFRLFWRLTHRPPALPVNMKPWEIWAAKLTHIGFYVLMIGIPLSGWALVSAAPPPYNFPIMWFGLFEWPHLPVTVDKELSHDFAEVHETLAYLTIILLGLHVGAALKHHFINKDNVLARMLPFLRGAASK